MKTYSSRDLIPGTTIELGSGQGFKYVYDYAVEHDLLTEPLDVVIDLIMTPQA